MRNSNKAVIYYLFFASQKPVAENIITDIFEKYRRRPRSHQGMDRAHAGTGPDPRLVH
jgi:hypothetical protein